MRALITWLEEDSMDKKTIRSGCSYLAACLAALVMALPVAARSEEGGREEQRGSWKSGDFHQHSFYTDGGTSFDFEMSMDNKFGLDWWANSEHGGTSGTDGNGNKWTNTAVYPVNPIKGDGAHTAMWRWQGLAEYVWPDVVRNRALYPDRRIFNGLEWNVPGHEHCSTGIVGKGPAAISAFEFMFDKSDNDTSRVGEVTPFGTLEKTNGSTYALVNGVPKATGKTYQARHEDAVKGCAWMQKQYKDKLIDNGWIVFAHVERAGLWTPASGGGYNVEHFRDFNSAGPDVCFGFEGAPGHQVEPYRGLGNTVTCTAGVCTSRDFGGTYGGTGFYTAKVGGLWDALLGEGRHFFNFASSDYHGHYTSGGGDFYPGEYQKDWVYVKPGEEREEERGGFGGREDDHDDYVASLNRIVNGMRSGKSFFVTGDLINHLDFTVRQDDREAGMGETLEVERRGEHHHARPVTIEITFRSPKVNNNGDKPAVDHIDLIAGQITGLVQPTDPNYTNPTNATTKVIASFDKSDWRTDHQGNHRIVYKLKHLDKNTYFRLRGTNLACGTPNQTGPATALPSADFCSPLPDALEGATADMNVNAQKAFADLWFYSNPIFTYVK
jgi:hypothetical protein